MLQKTTLEELANQTAAWRGPVLSAYLAVDPSHASNRNRSHAFAARFKVAAQNLETRLKDDAEAARLLRLCAADVGNELQNYRPNAKSVAIIRDSATGKEWRRELHVPVDEIVEWSEVPYILPLVDALDEYERYLVALLERGRARLFVVQAGEAEEIEDLSGQDVARRKTTGTDHRWSEANFRRRADDHVRRHLRDTIGALTEIVDRYSVDRLVIAGSIDAITELDHLLPRRLRRKLVGSVPLPMSSTSAQVVHMVEEIGAQAERTEEMEIVSRLVDSAGQGNRAALGLQPTVEAVRESNATRLVISGNYRPSWDDLPELEIWLRSDAPDRPNDLIESLVQKALQQGGRIEIVRGEAADRLQTDAGGIGVFLRH